MTESIPGPRGLPIIGNLLDLKHEEGSLKALENLCDIYGPVYKINVAGKRMIVVSSAELLIQIADEKNFIKTPPPSLGGGSGPAGLFTARSDDPDWAQGHRILAPAFGHLAVEDMFEGMKDIAFQLCLKWARTDEGRPVALTDDFTRLTLDTIALCTMDYRFNSFYTEAMHPFVDAMLTFLDTAQTRSSRPAILNRLVGSKEAEDMDKSSAMMRKIGFEIIARRRANPTECKDMLNTMLNGRDPKTGRVMRDELIAAQMTTFLVAGHETTSGALSFLFVQLMQNPKTYLIAQEEVDKVIGGDSIQLKHFKDLKYLNAALREALRITPTAPVISKCLPPSRHSEYVTIADGQYHVENKDIIRLMLSKCMRDPSYFGSDAEEFEPWRMHEDNPAFDHHMRAFKTFGNGSRACIGQGFAWQEAILVAALVLQNFDVNLSDSGYKMTIKQTLTVKPANLKVNVHLRKGLDATKLEQRLHKGSSSVDTSHEFTNDDVVASAASDNPGLTILYGTNQGTCQALAQRLSAAAARRGIETSVDDLDSAVNNLPQQRPVAVIVPSYEGQPPENAARFVSWLESRSDLSLGKIRYAVFGCGHKDWRDTFHRIPKLIDEKLATFGGTRLLVPGLSDVSKGAVVDDFTTWQTELFHQLGLEGGPTSNGHVANDIEISVSQRAQQLSSGLGQGKIIGSKLLTAPGEPEKRHLDIELPKGSEYEVGDYLAILPMNPDRLVQQIMSHWSLPRDATMTLKTNMLGNLPKDVPLSIHEVLKGSFELSQPLDKTAINAAKACTTDHHTISQLDELLTDEMAFKEATTTFMSLFDLLTKYESIKMLFTTFLDSLLPLKIRQYSISSSPLVDASRCSITYSVVKHAGPTDKEAQHEGVASTFLSNLKVGDSISVAVKRTATVNSACAFRLPAGPQQGTTPLIMLCAGTGIAPFRGFVQQRAVMLEQNPKLKLAPAILFVGCRTANGDRLYVDELEKWQKLGAVDVRYAFSKQADHPLAKGCEYVGDRMLRDMREVRNLWSEGAKVYLCGSRRMQQNVGETLDLFFKEVRKLEDLSEEEQMRRDQAFRDALAHRAVSDIFD